jgi:formylglycine-generating enzyme required for sulfatase activity
MKRHALFVGLLCFFGLFFIASELNALTIPASEDSYIAPRNTLSYSTNNANSLVVDATRKSYLYFDLSDIPADAVVRWAKLRLFLPTVRTTGAGLSVHLVTGTWNESTRLADVPSIVTGSLGMIAPSKMASRRFVTVDVTSTVQQWINGGTLNEGFAIQPIVKAGSPTASVMLTSKEGPVFGLPAELDIEFQPEGAVEKLPDLVQQFFSPKITRQPNEVDGLYVEGYTVGSGSLSYQWMHNGLPILGGTSALLQPHGLLSGTYAVVVSNGFASVTSRSVEIIQPPDGFARVYGEQNQVGAFYIGKTEVTWGEWKVVRDWAVSNGYDDLADVGAGVGDNYPVTRVNWFDAVKWCNARSEMEGKTPVYTVEGAVHRTGTVTGYLAHFDDGSLSNGYRLPSQTEWTIAARGGRWVYDEYSGSNNLDDVGWYSENSDGQVHEVGKKKANLLGIYDMSGNLWEWTGDWEFWTTLDSKRMIRGGGWSSSAKNCRTEIRDEYLGNSSYFWVDALERFYGFRVALNAAP